MNRCKAKSVYGTVYLLVLRILFQDAAWKKIIQIIHLIVRWTSNQKWIRTVPVGSDATSELTTQTSDVWLHVIAISKFTCGPVTSVAKVIKIGFDKPVIDSLNAKQNFAVGGGIIVKQSSET